MPDTAQPTFFDRAIADGNAPRRHFEDMFDDWTRARKCCLG